MAVSIWSALSNWVDDVIDNRSTTGDKFVENFDGLRAVAALMVFALHIKTIPHFVLGPAGVWLFFALSGFLLYSGFLRIKDLPDTSTIIAYLARRVFRVLPLFALCVATIAFVFMSESWTTDFALAWTQEHVLFVIADLHLWTMKTEMIFYLFLPVLILLLYPIRSEAWRFFVLVFAGVLAWYLFEVKYIMQLHGGMPFFTPFLFGMAAVHLRDQLTPLVARVLVIGSIAAMVVFGSDFAWGQPIREYFGLREMSELWAYGFLFYLPCAALVLGVSREKSRIWGNRFLRLVGVVGFGFYLWHLPIILIVLKWGLPTPVYELTSFGLTLGLSLLTYLLVEKPGINVGRKISRWVRADVAWFKVLRPAWVCLMLLAIFFAYRYPLVASEIEFAVEMWSSQRTVAKLYIDNGNGFSERRTAIAPVTPEKTWQRVVLRAKDNFIRKLRFDPGETDGEYRIRKISVRYPYHDTWHDLDLNKFKSVIGVKRLETGTELLRVVAVPDHKDPWLVYRGDTHQPFWRAQTLSMVMAVLATLLLVFASVLLDATVYAGAGVKRPTAKAHTSEA